MCYERIYIKHIISLRIHRRLIFWIYFSSIEDINRLLSKRLSTIYLEVFIEKKWRTQNSDFINLKSLSKLRVATYKSEVWEQNYMWLLYYLYYFYFERNNDVLKSKIVCFLLNKNINFSKNKTELKMENPTHNFREINLVLQFL